MCLQRHIFRPKVCTFADESERTKRITLKKNVMKNLSRKDLVVWNENTKELWEGEGGKVLVFGHECYSRNGVKFLWCWAEECTKEHLQLWKGERICTIEELVKEDVMAIVSIVEQGWEKFEEFIPYPFF